MSLGRALPTIIKAFRSGVKNIRVGKQDGPKVTAPRTDQDLSFNVVIYGSLGLLLLNIGCPTRGDAVRPLVLLDGSLSLGAPGARGTAARDSAAGWGDVRVFGDERPAPGSPADTVPTRGRSLLGPALTAAAASARPVIVVTDGEIEDAADLQPELLARTAVRVFGRDTVPDLAVTVVDGPERATAGDTVVLEVTVEAVGGARADTARVQVTNGSTRVGRVR